MRMAHREACRVFTPISQEGRPMDQPDQAHALNQPGGGGGWGGGPPTHAHFTLPITLSCSLLL